MRVLVVSHPCVVPSNQDLFGRLSAMTGWEIEIVLPRTWRSEYGEMRAARSPGFQGRLRPLPVIGSGNIPLHVYAARLSRVIAEAAPDVVYVHHEPYAAATAQVRRAMDRAGSAAALGFYAAQNVHKRYPWPVRRWERSAFERADFALPVSAEVACVLRRKGYPGPLRVLPLGIDTQRLQPAASTSPPRAFTVGYVGRLADEKGVDTFLRALARVDRDVAQGLVVGEGPAARDLRELASGLDLDDRLEWPGYVAHDRMVEAYTRMDLVVVPSRTVPSWREQFGRVVIEALACGVPVIASDSGELPRLVNGTAGGWIFPEDDVDALARGIAHAARDASERARRGTEGRRAVLAAYGLEAVARGFADEVESAAHRRAARGP